MTGSPYFAAIITASLVWVTYCWITRLLRGGLPLCPTKQVSQMTAIGTPGYLATNATFLISLLACTYNFYKGIVTDPGYVPKAESDTEVKMVSDKSLAVCVKSH